MQWWWCWLRLRGCFSCVAEVAAVSFLSFLVAPQLPAWIPNVIATLPYRRRCNTLNHHFLSPASTLFLYFVPPFDKAEVAKQLGTNVDTEDVGMVTARKEVDDKKKALADAFARKARALAEVEDILGEPVRRMRAGCCSTSSTVGVILARPSVSTLR